MPETEADRIGRARAQQRQEQKEEDKQRQAKQDQATQRDLAHQLETEIPVVMRLLAKYDYPGMIMINVPEKSSNPIVRFFDALTDAPPRYVQKAAWRLGAYQYYYSGYGDSGYTSRDIYLLSDGRIYLSGGGVCKPNEVGIEILRECLDGIHKLRRRLEAK